MKRKLIVGGILIATLLLLTSLTSVVGVQTIKTESNNSSPLFSSRLSTMIDKEYEVINSNYIGKGTPLNLFFNEKSYIRGWMDKAAKLIQTNPIIVNKIFSRIEKMPYIMNLLKENGISRTDITKYATKIKNNPSLLRQELDLIQIDIDKVQSPDTRGLSTSSPLGCFITIIALLPVIVILSVLIGTITIITCLNVNGCLETIMQNIYDQILQELIPT